MIQINIMQTYNLFLFFLKGSINTAVSKYLNFLVISLGFTVLTIVDGSNMFQISWHRGQQKVEKVLLKKNQLKEHFATN